MDKHRLTRIRNLPLLALGLKPKNLRPILERLGGAGKDDAVRFSVGDVMDAVETQKGFTFYDASEYGTLLVRFKQCLVRDEGMTYFDWRFLPPSTATPLLDACTKPRIRACDARVLNTIPNNALVHVANEFGKPVHPGKIIAPDTITIAMLFESRQFVLNGRQTTGFGNYLAATRDKLHGFGFTKRNGLLLEE